MIGTTKIILTSTTICDAIQAPDEGADMFDDVPLDLAASFLHDVDEPLWRTGAKVLAVTEVDLITRVLHKLLRQTILAASGGFSELAQSDIRILYELRRDQKINLGEVILDRMLEYIQRSRGGDIPYGRVITEIIRLAGIECDLEVGERCVPRFFSDAIILRMSFKLVGNDWVPKEPKRRNIPLPDPPVPQREPSPRAREPSPTVREPSPRPTQTHQQLNVLEPSHLPHFTPSSSSADQSGGYDPYGQYGQYGYTREDGVSMDEEMFHQRQCMWQRETTLHLQYLEEHARSQKREILRLQEQNAELLRRSIEDRATLQLILDKTVLSYAKDRQEHKSVWKKLGKLFISKPSSSSSSRRRQQTEVDEESSDETDRQSGSRHRGDQSVDSESTVPDER